VFNFLIDGLDLPGTFPAADDKVVGKAAHAFYVQQNNIGGLFISGSFNRLVGYFQRFQ
jgi:hypothetical protein